MEITAPTSRKESCWNTLDGAASPVVVATWEAQVELMRGTAAGGKVSAPLVTGPAELAMRALVRQFTTLSPLQS